uniref:MADS-box domain-containing protein n=1 Tax=Rhabditophanes sp. KR3021 TaxID=114890 RepID=A0AC35UGK9_9BILA
MASSSPSKESSPLCDSPSSTDPLLNSLFGTAVDLAASLETSSVANGGLLPNGKKTKGRVKIKMEYIGNKLRRYTTFSKRKTGIMKKAFELSTLTGTQVMLLVASETGHVYTFATSKLKPMISSDQGRNLIQTCLNTPDDKVEDASSCKTEFTFEPPMGSVGGSARKRKFHDSETMALPALTNHSNLTMTSCTEADFDSGDDSDSGDGPEPSSSLLYYDNADSEKKSNGKNVQEILSNAFTKKGPVSKSNGMKAAKRSVTTSNGKNIINQNALNSLIGAANQSHNTHSNSSSNNAIDSLLPTLLHSLLTSSNQSLSNENDTSANSSHNNMLSALFGNNNMNSLNFNSLLAAAVLNQSSGHGDSNGGM